MRIYRRQLMKINLIIACLACIFTVSIFTHEVSAGSITKIKITKRSASDSSGVASADCGSREKVVGGGCTCGDSDYEDDLGYLFWCAPAGNSYLGGCFPMDVNQTYNTASVYALCMSTTPKGKISLSSSGYSAYLQPLTDSSVDSSVSSEVTAMENKLLNMIEERRMTLSK